MPTTARSPQVIPTLPFGNLVTVFGKILTTGIAPSRWLKIRAKREPPNNLLKIKGRHKKDVKNEVTSPELSENTGEN